MNINILISNEHFNVKEVLFTVYLTNFVGCSENEGGAIYSNFKEGCAVLANSCIFTNCSAIGESGRGSAIRILYGNTIVQKCCLYNCKSSFGGDIQTASSSNGIHCINVQTFEDTHQNHPTMFGGKIIEVISSLALESITLLSRLPQKIHFIKTPLNFSNKYQLRF